MISKEVYRSRHPIVWSCFRRRQKECFLNDENNNAVCNITASLFLLFSLWQHGKCGTAVKKKEIERAIENPIFYDDTNRFSCFWRSTERRTQLRHTEALVPPSSHMRLVNYDLFVSVPVAVLTVCRKLRTHAKMPDSEM